MRSRKWLFLLLVILISLPLYAYSQEKSEGAGKDEEVKTSTKLLIEYQRLKRKIKEALKPRIKMDKNFFGLHYKNLNLGDTLRFHDESYTTPVSNINSNFNAWGFSYVRLQDYLRIRFGANFYEYVKLNYSYKPTSASSAVVDQIKLNEIDFSAAYVVYLNEQFPLYGGGGLSAGHMKIQATEQAREMTLGYAGLKFVLGASYIFDETLYLDACYHSVPLGMNQSYATTISTGIAF